MFSGLKRRVIWVRHSSLVRLTSVISAIFAVAFAVVSVLTFYLVERQTLARLDAELRTIAAQDIDSDDVILPPGIIAFTEDRRDDFPRPFDRLSRYRQGIFSLAGYRYRGESDWRILLERKDDEWVLVAKSLSDRETVLDVIGSIYTSVAGVALILGVAVGLGLATYAQRRFDRIRQVLSALAQGDLCARAPRVDAR